MVRHTPKSCYRIHFRNNLTDFTRIAGICAACWHACPRRARLCHQSSILGRPLWRPTRRSIAQNGGRYRATIQRSVPWLRLHVRQGQNCPQDPPDAAWWSIRDADAAMSRRKASESRPALHPASLISEHRELRKVGCYFPRAQLMGMCLNHFCSHSIVYSLVETARIYTATVLPSFLRSSLSEPKSPIHTPLFPPTTQANIMCTDENSAPHAVRYLNAQLAVLHENADRCLQEHPNARTEENSAPRATPPSITPRTDGLHPLFRAFLCIGRVRRATACLCHADSV